MRVARTVLILLLVMSLPVSAFGVVDGRMPCDPELPHAAGDRAAAIDHGSSHAHPAQPGDGAPVVDNFAADIDLAGRIARCPCGTDCDMTHCAGVNHTTAVVDPGHLLPVIAASAAPPHRQQLRLSAPAATLLRPPIAV